MGEHSHHDKHEAHRGLVKRLRQLAADADRLTRGLEEADLERRVMEGKWSLKELVCHCWRVEQVFEERVEAMLGGENPAIVPYNPDGDVEFDRMAAMDGAGIVAGFQASRARFAERLEQLPPEQWHRKGRHPEYTRYDVHFQVEYMVHHEAHHLYQMFQRRAMIDVKVPH